MVRRIRFDALFSPFLFQPDCLLEGNSSHGTNWTPQ
jgi:hypothetical protein